MLLQKLNGSDFEVPRVVITPYDLYEAYRMISAMPKGSKTYKVYSKYLHTLYDRRKELFPTDESILPRYVAEDDIPNQNVDYLKYNRFFADLRSSLKQTYKQTVEAIGEDEPIVSEEVGDEEK